VSALPIKEIAPQVIVEGPVPEFAEQVRRLHYRFHGRE
jgi:hypothetical protein